MCQLLLTQYVNCLLKIASAPSALPGDYRGVNLTCDSAIAMLCSVTASASDSRMGD